MVARRSTEPAEPPDPEGQARQLAGEALGAGDPTGWFERLYASAEMGHAVVPWDRAAPHRVLVEWAASSALDGAGRRAVVVGCGLGEDAQYVAGLGFDTTAFDISASAVRGARHRFPDSAVRYVTADLLRPPAEWRRAFDLVVESLTLQALPDPPRRDAIRNVAELVAPGGQLVVIARAQGEREELEDGPPWPLTRAEIDAFTAAGLDAVQIEELDDPGPPPVHRWRAHFRRR